MTFLDLLSHVHTNFSSFKERVLYKRVSVRASVSLASYVRCSVCYQM